jgi:hypothetical protein
MEDLKKKDICKQEEYVQHQTEVVSWFDPARMKHHLRRRENHEPIK